MLSNPVTRYRSSGGFLCSALIICSSISRGGSELQKEMSYLNQLYLITGDIGKCIRNRSEFCCSKQMTSSYNLESPYELVSSNKWTIDKFVEMSTTVSKTLTATEWIAINSVCFITATLWPRLIGADVKFTTKRRRYPRSFDFLVGQDCFSF